MPAVRKSVLDAMRSALSDATYGFNARLASVRGTYQLDAADIDFSDSSQSVFYGQVADQAQTGLTGRLTLRIATGRTVWTGRTKGMKWSGDVEGVLVFTVEYSHAEREEDGIEDYDIIERWKGAIEDCVVEVFARPGIEWGTGVAYGGAIDCPDLPDAELANDGWEQVMPFRLIFRVDAA